MNNTETNKWVPYTDIKLSNLENIKLKCFYTDKYIIGSDQAYCIKNGNSFLNSSNNESDLYALNLGGNNYGIKLGLKKRISKWKRLVLYDLGFETAVYDFDKKIGNNFLLINDPKLALIKNKKSLSYVLYFNYLQTRVLDYKWAYAYGITGHYEDSSLDKFKNNNKTNISLNLQLSRKINNALISFYGGFRRYRSIGIDPTEKFDFVIRDSDKKNYNHFGLKIEFFRQSKNYNNLENIETLYSSYINKKNPWSTF